MPGPEKSIHFEEEGQERRTIYNDKKSSRANTNKHMSGINRQNQITSNYTSPKKSIRWYKKYHSICWNAFCLYRKYYNSTHEKIVKKPSAPIGCYFSFYSISLPA